MSIRIPRLKKSFTERDTLRIGIGGTVLFVVVMTLAFQYQKLPLFNKGRHLSAQFAEVGSLRPGDFVQVSGASVGRVTSVKLSGAKVIVRFDVTASKLNLGTLTHASIVTVTLLGRAGLTLDPAGTGNLSSGAVIPLERTSAPYDVTSALADLTTNTAQIDVKTLAKALDTVSGTVHATPQGLHDALEGISKISQTLAQHDAGVQQLLSRAKDVTSVLARRNTQVSTLLTAGSQLLVELNSRQQAITDLLQSASALSDQIHGLITENNTVLKSSLTQLDKVVALLNKNKANLQQTIDGLRSYAVSIGEPVASGPFFQAYVQNLTAPTTLVPVLSGVVK